MGAWDEWEALLAQPNPDPLEVVTLAAQYQRYLDAIVERAIPAARNAGATWEQIGTAVGTTRQAAWQRYRFLLTNTTLVDPVVLPCPPGGSVWPMLGPAVQQETTEEDHY
jgi:hypothetical protein